MLERHQDHERRWFAFMTHTDRPAGDPVTVELEPFHPDLKKPRIVVTCPRGAGVSHVKAAFVKRGWEGPIYDAWWVKNGKILVKYGGLRAD
jgi:hypothetical protein